MAIVQNHNFVRAFEPQTGSLKVSDKTRWPVVPTGSEPAIGLSVVVPCYNEQETLGELHRRTSIVCAACAGEDYELVLVNDGSEDGTWALMQAIVLRDPHVVAVNLARNHGHQLALSAGMTVCTGERILIMDADLQDPPELLPEMIALMHDGADVVYAQRERRMGETWFKRVSAAAFYRILDKLVDVRVPRDTGDFRLLSRRALNIINSMPERHRFIRGMVSWIGLKQVPLRYERSARFAGETKYPFSKMISLAVDAITGFSTVPLRFATLFGMITSLGALLALIYVLSAWASGQVVEGWTSLMVIVLTVSAVQLFVLGIMGEYLGRMFMEAKQRPVFLISEVVRHDEANVGGAHEP